MMRPLQDRREMFFREYIPEGAKVLEIGASTGFFLDRIRDDYSVHATEFNPEHAAFLRDELKIPTDEAEIDEAFPGEQFTVICAYHVLEHQPDPIAFLGKIKDRLIGGGWVILETPNANDALVSIYDIPEFRDFFFRESHLVYFEQTTLANVLLSQGFESRVYLRQDYSLMNHLNWLYRMEPQASAPIARLPINFVHPEHPASIPVNRFFARIDREYRTLMDTLVSTNALSAVGRKREI
jgi:SAM-dependent methyltransferase